nr:hypothetical protein [uncultured Campylobacter sp.]
MQIIARDRALYRKIRSVRKISGRERWMLRGIENRGGAAAVNLSSAARAAFARA